MDKMEGGEPGARATIDKMEDLSAACVALLDPSFVVTPLTSERRALTTDLSQRLSLVEKNAQSLIVQRSEAAAAVRSLDEDARRLAQVPSILYVSFFFTFILGVCLH